MDNAGKLCNEFLKIRNVKQGTSSGIEDLILTTLRDAGINLNAQYMIGLGCDGLL